MYRCLFFLGPNLPSLLHFHFWHCSIHHKSLHVFLYAYLNNYFKMVHVPKIPGKFYFSIWSMSKSVLNALQPNCLDYFLVCDQNHKIQRNSSTVQQSKKSRVKCNLTVLPGTSQYLQRSERKVHHKVTSLTFTLSRTALGIRSSSNNSN